MRATLALAAVAVLGFTSGLRAGDAAYTAAVLEDGPLLYWTFDEADGPAVEQILGHATGALVPMGSATRGPSTMTAGGASLGSAAVFNGAPQSRFQASDVIPGVGAGGEFIASQRWAVEFWVNLGGTGATYISEMYGPPGSVTNNPSFIHGFNANLEMYAGTRTGAVPALALTPNVWHHVVGAFYGNNSGHGDNLREFYVDGSLVYSDTTSNFSAGHGLNQFSVGNAVAPADNAATLMVDEYAIYELPGNGAPAGAAGGDPGSSLLNDQIFVEGIAAHYFAAVPEPSSVTLAIIGIGVAAWMRRRRRSR